MGIIWSFFRGWFGHFGDSFTGAVRAGRGRRRGGAHFGNPTPKLRPSGPRSSPRAPDGQDPAHQHGIRPSLSQNLREEKIGGHIICPSLRSGRCPPGYRAGWILPVWGAWGGSRARGPQFGGRISKTYDSRNHETRRHCLWGSEFQNLRLENSRDTETLSRFFKF